MDNFNDTMQSIKNINNFFSDLQEDISSNCCDDALNLGGFCMECGEQAIISKTTIQVLQISPTTQVPVTCRKTVSVNGKPSSWKWNANPKSVKIKTFYTGHNEEREEAMRGNY